MWGGVLVLSAILALSLAFASCANNSDSDDGGNPSPALPDNVGENPITKTIKLNKNNDNYSYLELKTDGTALEIYIDDHKNNAEETRSKFKYTYDADAKRIYMKVEKLLYQVESFDEAEGQLLTYDEIRSKINEDFTIKKARQFIQKNYEEIKNDTYFKEEYPDCNSYEDYEVLFAKSLGFDSLEAFVKYWKQMFEDDCKTMFGGQITYSYKIENGKLTLTEKFTGVKNLIGDSECEYNSYDDNQNYTYARITSTYADIRIYENGVRYDYDGTLDIDKGTIDFTKRKEIRSDDGDYEDDEILGNVTATYTEEIDRGRVTINCEGKEYVCKFEGEKYTQVE